MKESNASMLLLKFLPRKNKNAYLLDIKGYTLDEMAIELKLSIEEAKELLHSTRIIAKKLTLILLQTNANDFPVPLPEVETIKEMLIEESIRLGRKEIEERLGGAQNATKLLNACREELFDKLFGKD